MLFSDQKCLKLAHFSGSNPQIEVSLLEKWPLKLQVWPKVTEIDYFRHFAKLSHFLAEMALCGPSN